ncbi:MAG: hypothetical protein L0Y43_08460 [Methylococcaceae bacterium]|nr:hypothetical protein [Methylococcaceae bacterium]
MKRNSYNYFRTIPESYVLAMLVCSSTAFAQDYECMLIQAKPVDRYITTQEAEQGAFPVGQVVLEGTNFGTNPKVYFGADSRPTDIVSLGHNNNLDSITLQLPAGTGIGTYKLIIQNTSGPFLDNNGKVNPIFCFGSVTIGIVKEYSGS